VKKGWILGIMFFMVAWGGLSAYEGESDAFGVTNGQVSPSTSSRMSGGGETKVNLVVFHPLQTLLGIVLGGFETRYGTLSVSLEYQRCLLPWVSGYVFSEVFSPLEDLSIWGVWGTTGLYVRFFDGSRTESGWYVRLGTGGAYASFPYLMVSSVVWYGGEAMVGYQLHLWKGWIALFGLGVDVWWNMTLKQWDIMPILEIGRLGCMF